MPGDEPCGAELEQALKRRDPALERSSPHDRGDADEEDVGRDRDPRVRDPNDQITRGVRGTDLDQANLAAADVKLEFSGELASRLQEPHLVEVEGLERLAHVGRDHRDVAAPRIREWHRAGKPQSPPSAPKRFISAGDSASSTAVADSVAMISAPRTS